MPPEPGQIQGRDLSTPRLPWGGIRRICLVGQRKTGNKDRTIRVPAIKTFVELGKATPGTMCFSRRDAVRDRVPWAAGWHQHQ